MESSLSRKAALSIAAAIPPTGTPLLYRGQSYRVDGEQLHRRADGTITMLMRLSTNCPDCGVVFTCIAVPRDDTELTRRCPEHKRPGVQV